MYTDGAAPVRAKIKEIVPEYYFEADNSSWTERESSQTAQFRAVAGHD